MTVANLTISSATVNIDGDRVKIEAPLTEEIKAQLPKAGRWKPEIGQAYWCVASVGGAYHEVWRDAPNDLFCFSVGNCHPTEEAAITYRDRQILRQKLYDIRDECGGSVSDGSEATYQPSAFDGKWSALWKCAATEFGFKCHVDCERFLSLASNDLTEYFKPQEKI